MTPGRAREAGFTLIEVLVAMLILGVVAGATFTVVLSAQRSQRFTEQVQDATNDARLSVERIRQQLRMSRLITQPSDQSAMRFWVDENQDGLQDVGEVLCYSARPVTGEPDRYELVRWRDVVGSPAELGTDCSSFSPPSDATVIARTLRNVDIFEYSTATTGFTAIDPATITNDPPVRRVDVQLEFDVFTTTGPDVFSTGTKVRLRNVP